MDQTAGAIWSALKVPPQVATDFITVFARFEYALKRNKYLLGTIGDDAQPDWGKFASHLHARCQDAQLAPILEMASYLVTHPPRKQRVGKGHSLVWSEPGRRPTDIRQLLLAVRTTRNNLLHGGKFPSGPVDEPLRDEKLIRDCSRVLEACLALPCEAARGVRNAFFDLDAGS